MNFTALLRAVARRHPGQDAVVDGERRTRYRDLWGRVVATARRYCERGLRPGDRILILLPNGAEFLVCHFAALQLGAISVPVRTEYRSWEVRRMLADCRPRLVVAQASWLEVNGAAMDGLPAGAEVLTGEKVACEPVAGDGAAVPVPSTAPASIHYSYMGGGCARGAVLSHGSHTYAAIGYARHMSFGPADRLAVLLPMAHVYALSGCVNSGLIRGAALVILHRSTPRHILDAVQRERITVLTGVPPLFELLARFGHLGRYDRSSLRLCVTGGSFMEAAAQASFEAALGARLVQGYGLTECMPMICNPAQGTNKHGTLGVPGRKDIQVRIVGPSGETLQPGERGEIAVSGPTLMSGYFGRPEDTARVLRGGWLYTGDEGTLDAEGTLYFVKLRKNILNLYGNKVDPLEVAAALREHPAVASAQVRGEWASERPEAASLVATVDLAPGRDAGEAELKSFLRERIAAYKVPACIAVRKAAAAGSERPRSDDERRLGDAA